MTNYRTRGQDTVWINDADKQFSTKYALLAEGRYREWFWRGLSSEQISFLKGRTLKRQPPPADNAKVDIVASQPRGWQHEAACAGADPSIFISEGHYPKKDYLDPDAKWRQHCPTCPVQQECLQMAREFNSEGIHGGKLFYFMKHGAKIIECDEENMPMQGRPRQYKTVAERSKAYRERKKADAKISGT